MTEKTIYVPEVINVCDLGQWLKACRKHEVPHIPATEIGSCCPVEIFSALDNDPSLPCENLKKLRQTLEGIDLGHDMLRWNLCAPEELKYRMAKEGDCSVESRQKAMMFDDPRLVSIIENQSPLTVLTLYRRPWIEPKRHDGWPIEFRVFVENHRVQGVSNYYPQISLPADYESVAEEAVSKTEPLLDAARAFTADWLMRPDGSLWYLEGGPPHNPSGGAHMCCFRPGEIDGIALSDRNKEPTNDGH